MDDYPKTLTQFEERFSTEEACWLYLCALRWPDGFVCPRCAQQNGWLMGNKLHWCKSCDYKASVTAGTIFERTKKPLMDWLRVIWWVTGQKYGASAKGLQRMLGIGSYETVDKASQIAPRRLSGNIEVDETFVGGAKHDGKCGRGASGKALVLMVVQLGGKKLGRIRLKRIADASAQSLEGAIQETVELGSVIRTDGWAGYKQIGSRGYIHEVVRSDAEVGDNLLPACNLVASLMKRWLGGTL